jgi:hypothetical protein
VGGSSRALGYAQLILSLPSHAEGALIMTGNVKSIIGNIVFVSNNNALLLAVHASCRAELCFAPHFCTEHFNLDMQPDNLCPFL